MTRGRETRRGAHHATRVSLARETRAVDAGSSGDRTSLRVPPHLTTDSARTRDREVHAPHSRATDSSPKRRALSSNAFDSREDRDDAPAAIKTRRTGPRERRAAGAWSRCGVSRCRRDARGAGKRAARSSECDDFPEWRPVGSGQVLLQQHRVLDRRAGGGGGVGGGGERGKTTCKFCDANASCGFASRPQGRARRAVRLRGIAGTKHALILDFLAAAIARSHDCVSATSGAALSSPRTSSIDLFNCETRRRRSSYTRRASASGRRCPCARAASARAAAAWQRCVQIPSDEARQQRARAVVLLKGDRRSVTRGGVRCACSRRAPGGGADGAQADGANALARSGTPGCSRCASAEAYVWAGRG